MFPSVAVHRPPVRTVCRAVTERVWELFYDTLVDAYGAHEHAYGWHAYLDDTLDVPFEARCSAEREEFLLKEGEMVSVRVS